MIRWLQCWPLQRLYYHPSGKICRRQLTGSAQSSPSQRDELKHEEAETSQHDSPLDITPIPLKRPPPNLLHLYRALLRECTYLPLPAARAFMSIHLSNHFHRHKTYPPPPPPTNPATKILHSPLRQRRNHIHLAHKTLISLRRANAGHTVPLKRILSLTYARSGPRRWDILAPFRVPHANLDETAIPDIPTLIPALSALVKAQGPRMGVHKVFNDVLPMIAEKNVWGRAMPRNRVRNKKRKWYEDVMRRVMVPLPERERESLRRLVVGEEEVKLRERRVRVTTEEEERDGGRTGEETYKSQRGISRPHELTARYLKRLLMGVLKECPVLEEVDGKLKVRWFDEAKAYRLELKGAERSPMAEGVIAKMFEGVDDEGRVVNENDRKGIATGGANVGTKPLGKRISLSQ